MKQCTWPSRSDGSRFSALPPQSINGVKEAERARKHRSSKLHSSSSSSSSSSDGRDFSALPYDVVAKIAASFGVANLRAASLVCRSWCEALRPLREAMVLLCRGKRFKHGRGGVRVNLDKALNSFLKGASRGSTRAMVDAGLLYWEIGQKDKALSLYQKAAALGDPSGQFNLGVSYLQAEPPSPKEAVRWLGQSAMAGHVRAQYQLALCLHHGCGVDNDIQEAVWSSIFNHQCCFQNELFSNLLCNYSLLTLARWYMKAAEGGYVRAMYNVALCYSFGEGLVQSHQLGRKWMKRAADRGHAKAQVEHGRALFSGGEMLKAIVYLELASRGGETGGAHVKNMILQQPSTTSCDRALNLADNWRALHSSSRVVS